MKKELPHIRISGPTDKIGFTTNPQFVKPHYPTRTRDSHGKRIKEKLEEAWKETESELVAIHSARTGAYIEFQSSPSFDIAIKSLVTVNK